MAMGWSAEAQAILASNTINARLTATIDVEYSDGEYGTYLVDVTSRIVEWGRLTRATSAIETNFNTTQIILLLQNTDAYLTPNLMGGGRDKISNVWSFRTPPGSEASYRDCRVHIDMAVKLASGVWETKRLSTGTIADLNLIDDNGPMCELVIKDTAYDCFDKVLGMPDGSGGYSTSAGNWTALTWDQFNV